MVSSLGRMSGGGCGGKDGDGCPRWLPAFLHVAYFKTCLLHADSHRNECKMFCTNCMGDPFCFYCSTVSHDGHRVIQVRKSSYHEVVRASEIQKFIDISGIQTFIINKAKVVFLNERPQPKPRKKVINACLICHKTLEFPFRFCSIGCKLNAMKRGDKNTSFSPRPRADDTEDLSAGAESDESSTPGKVQKTKHSGGPRNMVPSPDQKRDGHDRSSSSVDETNAENATNASPFDHRNSRKRKAIQRERAGDCTMYGAFRNENTSKQSVLTRKSCSG
ncbi:hypothetical protein MLD38_002188 [Melastoma candidum]|uniref:Uncharacterized protein n=1 Tax=Melastoma candidum TaxID=119954 RepID=A0ACB9SKJ7_9MYRT|nr:hypothetical protein MLD38_002188 [Melastoma candidum]